MSSKPHREFERGSGAARAASRPGVELRLGLVVAALVAVAGWLSTISIDGMPWQSPYLVRIVLPAGAPLLHPGDEVRIGGERTGQVTGVSLGPGGSGTGLATLSIGGRRIGAGATARVRPRGIAGAVYVELAPGDPRHPEPSGTTIRASGGVELTDVIASFDSAARTAMASALTGYGAGLAGAGPGVNRMIAQAPGLLGDVPPVMQALTPRPGVLSSSIAAARTVAGALGQGGRLPDVVSELGAVLRASGGRAAAIAASLSALPGAERQAGAVLPQASALVGELGRAAAELDPGVRALSRALPSVLDLERRAAALEQFGQLGARAVPVLWRLAGVLARAAGPAGALTPLSAPAVRLAATLIPYRQELRDAPLGFTRWGDFTYGFGTAAGHRAVRFSMILTCARARDPYPAPGAAERERAPCP